MLIIEKVESNCSECKKLENLINNDAPKKLPGQSDRVLYESSLKVAKTSAEQELAYMKFASKAGLLSQDIVLAKFMGIQDETKEERLKMEARYRREHGLTDDIYFNDRVQKKKGISNNYTWLGSK